MLAKWTEHREQIETTLPASPRFSGTQEELSRPDRKQFRRRIPVKARKGRERGETHIQRRTEAAGVRFLLVFGYIS